MAQNPLFTEQLNDPLQWLPFAVLDAAAVCSIPHSFDYALAERLIANFARPEQRRERTTDRVIALPFAYQVSGLGWRFGSYERALLQQRAGDDRIPAISEYLVGVYDAEVGTLPKDSPRRRRLAWNAAFHAAAVDSNMAFARIDELLDDGQRRDDDLSTLATALNLCRLQRQWLPGQSLEQTYLDGRYAYARGEYERAETLLATVWMSGGRHRRKLIAGHLLGALLRRLGGEERLVKAEAVLRQVLDLAVELKDRYSEAHVRHTLASTLRDLGGLARLEEAEDHARRCITIAAEHYYNSRTHVLGLVTLGRVLLDADSPGTQSTIESVLTEAVDRARKRRYDDVLSNALDARAQLSRRLGRYSEAVRDQSEVANLSPLDPNQLRRLASTLIAAGPAYYASAELRLSEAYRLRPNDETVVRQLRNLRHRMKQHERWQVALASAAPQTGQQWAELGRAYMRDTTLSYAERYRTAVDYFSRAEAAGFADREFLYRYGEALARVGRHPGAVRQFELAISGGHHERKVWTMLAVSLSKVGEIERAATLFQKALGMDPKAQDDSLRAAYAAFLADERGALDEAEEYVRQAIRRKPTSVPYRITLVRVLMRRGTTEAYEQAKRILSEVKGRWREENDEEITQLIRELAIRHPD